MKKLPAVLLLVACAVVVAAAFLPWIRFTLQLSPELDLEGLELEGMQAAMSEMQATMSDMFVATGWQGHITLLGLTLPNWLVPVSSIAIALMTLMRVADVWETPVGLSIGFAGYCLGHLGVLLFVAMAAPEARPGFGAFLALLGSIGGLSVTIFGRSDDYATVSVPQSGFEIRETMRCDPTPDDVPAPPGFSPSASPRERV